MRSLHHCRQWMTIHSLLVLTAAPWPSTHKQDIDMPLLSCPPTPQHHSSGLHLPLLMKHPQHGAEPISGSVLAPVQASSCYRRSHSGKPPALNAEFEIDPVANAGMPFAFNEVVRGQCHHHRLNASECKECQGVSGPYSPLLLNAGIPIFASCQQLKSWCHSGMQQWGHSHHSSRHRDGAHLHRAHHCPPLLCLRWHPTMGIQERM
jgi:hypothetical protein